MLYYSTRCVWFDNPYLQADKRVKNFYPNWELMLVTTDINLMSLYCVQEG